MEEEVRSPPQIKRGNVTWCFNELLEAYTHCITKNHTQSISTEVIVLMFFLYGIISFVSVYGNTLVIWLISTMKTMQTANNIFIANLALSDITIAIFCIPFQFYAALVQRWDLPKLMCKFCPFAQTFSINVSIFTLLAIAQDRYKAVCRPFSVSHSKKTANWMIILIWILSIVFAIPMVIFHQFTYSKDSHGIKPFCTPYKITHKVIQSSRNTTQNTDPTKDEDGMEPYDIYMLVLLFYQYFIPLLILAFVYGKMSVILWETKTPGNADDERDKNIFLQKKKSVKMMVTVVVTFGLCWLPWHAFHCAKLVWPEVLGYEYINVVFFVSHWIAMSNSCYNPFIYAIFSEKFKKGLSQKACCGRVGGSRHDSGDEGEEIPMTTNAGKPQETLQETHV